MFQYAAIEPDRVLSHLAKICYEHRVDIVLRAVRFAIRVHHLHYSSFFHGPDTWLPNCVVGGSMSSAPNVTSTTLLGVSWKSAADKNVLGPRGLFCPSKHRGEPEL